MVTAAFVTALILGPLNVEEVEPEPEPELDGYVESIAFEEIMPDAPGEWDVRLSVEAGAEPEEAETTQLLLPRAQLFLGLVRGLSVELDVPLLLRASGSERRAGPGDLGLGLKWQLLGQRAARPALIALFEARLPTGRLSGLGDGQFELEASLGWSLVFAPAVLQGRVGYSLALPSASHEVMYDASCALRLPHGVFAFVEGGGRTWLATGRTAANVGPGVKVHFTPELFIAAAALFGLTEAADPWRLLLQVQYGF